MTNEETLKFIDDRLAALEAAMAYQTKLLEDLTLNLGKGSESAAQIKEQMGHVQQLIASNPAIQNNPVIAGLMKSIVGMAG
jgi:uncharacterized coiled-coil protein SlyX